MSEKTSGEIFLIRHGETAWSLSGQHTSITDLPLTEQGRERASNLRSKLAGRSFALVLSSPMQRALETCRLAGYTPQIEPDLNEWNYGAYEGLTSDEIHKTRPGWTIWNGAPLNGETAEQVGARTDRVLKRALASGGDTCLFAHGHLLRVLAARWLELAPENGSLFSLDTGSISVLGWEHTTHVIREWNQGS